MWSSKNRISDDRGREAHKVIISGWWWWWWLVLVVVGDCGGGGTKFIPPRAANDFLSVGASSCGELLQQHVAPPVLFATEADELPLVVSRSQLVTHLLEK